jgi:hypothetical protein
LPEDEYLRNVGESVQAMLDPFGKHIYMNKWQH